MSACSITCGSLHKLRSVCQQHPCEALTDCSQYGADSDESDDCADWCCELNGAGVAWTCISILLFIGFWSAVCYYIFRRRRYNQQVLVQQPTVMVDQYGQPQQTAYVVHQNVAPMYTTQPQQQPQYAPYGPPQQNCGYQ